MVCYVTKARQKPLFVTKLLRIEDNVVLFTATFTAQPTLFFCWAISDTMFTFDINNERVTRDVCLLVRFNLRFIERIILFTVSFL